MSETNAAIALVTGASRGLGKEMALRIAERGLDLILTYKTKKQEAEAVVASVKQMGRKAVALPLDAGDTKSFEAFFAAVANALKTHFQREKFDILINNAGIGINAPFSQTTEAQFDELMDVQFKGVFFLTQKALPMLNDGGRIINISSGLARFTGPGFSAYASMKGAVETLTRYLAKELGPRRITVNTVAPGAIETDFNHGAVRDNAQYNQVITSATALGRVGLPADIGGVVAFMCTDDARWINAQRIEVSGGAFL